MTALDHIYRLDGLTGEWFSRILRAVKPEFDRGLGIVGWRLSSAQPGALWDYGEVDSCEGIREGLQAGRQRHGSEQQFRDILIRSEVTGLKELLGRMGTVDALWPSFESEFDYFTSGRVRDLLGAVHMDYEGTGFVVQAASRERVKVSRTHYKRWSAIMRHVAHAHRVRRKLIGSDWWKGAEAIFSAQKVDHVRSSMHGKAHLKKLTSILMRYQESPGLHASDELEAWPGFIDGRWTLVSYVDTDNRRFMLLVENDDPQLRLSRLTDSERAVISAAVGGLSNQVIGSLLNLSPTRTSDIMRSALRKLGFSNRAECMQAFHAASTPPRNEER